MRMVYPGKDYPLQLLERSQAAVFAISALEQERALVWGNLVVVSIPTTRNTKARVRVQPETTVKAKAAKVKAEAKVKTHVHNFHGGMIGITNRKEKAAKAAAPRLIITARGKVMEAMGRVKEEIIPRQLANPNADFGIKAHANMEINASLTTLKTAEASRKAVVPVGRSVATGIV